MSKTITKHDGGRWKAGQSGNPKGRPSGNRTLTEILRARGNKVMVVGGEEITAQEAVARALWQVAVTGEVWLAGKKLSAESLTEWVNVVKWIYTQIEPPKMGGDEVQPEMVVRVVRGEVRPENPTPLPHWRPQSVGEGEEDNAEDTMYRVPTESEGE